MTKLSELRKRWMADPEFRREYEKVDVEYERQEAELRRTTDSRDKTRLEAPTGEDL